MHRKATRLTLLVIVPAVFLSVAGLYYMMGGRYIVTDNAYIKAHLVNISSDIDGRVTEIPVANNQKVKQGDLLFRIDSEPAEIELMAARAEIANVRQRIDSLKSQYRQAILEIDDSNERIKFLASQLKRQQKLKKQGHGLEIDFERAEHELVMGRRALASANQRSAIVLVDLGGDPDFPAEKHALYLSAQTKVDKALRDLRSTKVTAPADGTLSNVTLEAGEYVESGDLIFAIVASSDIWIEANLKESQLTHLKENQTATVVVHAYPDIELSAVVSSLSPATGAEFAVLPPQNATGNWVKVVQRIPVRLDIVQSPPGLMLRAGMTSTVQIDTEHKRELPKFLRSVLASVIPNK